MKYRLFLLLPLLTIFLPCIAGDATQLVYDTEGHELSSDSLYYILPVDRGTGGGIKVSPDKTESCKFFVVQSRSEAVTGIPVQFKPQNASAGAAVRLSTDIRIRFRIITTCMKSSEWYVTNSSPLTSRQNVAIMGRVGGPEPPPSAKVFRVERYDGATKGYKLVSCTGEGPCKDVGLDTSEETTWLATSNSPFVVVFKKADA
ncbi:alpha-amylase/subtilisin inhibitor-like [Phragmites australis]|uniref:alpha-amylase/subtilisin inhibitor-like n=1 Tax=Phragmites australis TaxID=29695 RepID=UPI002D7874AC|nr:alpha-amylase/subtilisin inhibitor-like [Phragmites australis]